MIVRILGEGQYELPEAALGELNELDTDLQAAADAGDETRFSAALGELLAAVRRLGTIVPDDVLSSSDLVLPARDATLNEVGALLGDEGLIPG